MKTQKVTHLEKKQADNATNSTTANLNQVQNENRLRTLIEHGSDAIQLVNQNGKVLFSSNSIKRVLGYTPAEIQGHEILPYLHPDDNDYFSKKFSQLLRNPKKTITLQYRVKHKNGSWAWIEVNAANHFNTPGINALVGNFHNITERKKIEERQLFLEKISSTLFTTFDHLTLQKVAQLIVPAFADICRIATIADDGKITELAVNHADPKKIQLATDLYDVYKNNKNSTFGIPTILRTGKPEIIELIDEKVLKTFKSDPKVTQIVQKIGLKSYIGVPLIARGKIIGALVASSVQPQRYYQKEDLHFLQELGRRIAIALDNANLYNESKRLRLEAENEKNRLTYGQKAGKIGTYEWNLLNNQSTWTQEFEALYGYTNSDFKGGTTDKWIKFVHPDDQKEVLKETARTIKKGDELNLEYRIIWPDKTVHYIANRARIIRNKKGKAILVYGVNIDITERKIIENNLHYLAEVSKTLSSSLDYKTTLVNVAKLTVPQIADWCSIEIKTEKGLEQLAIAHVDPKKVKWAKKIRKNDPSDMNATYGIAKVLSTGIPEYYSAIPDTLLVQTAKSEEQLQLLRKLGMSSIMIVPLQIGKTSIGVISFIASESGRHYTKSDLTMAEEVANRAALAIENSRLYTNSQKAISIRDEFISVASHELKTPVTSLKMYTQILQKEFEYKGEEKVSYSLMKMNMQINKLTVLISDLLNVTKLQLGKLEFNESNFDMNDLIDEVIESVQQTATQHTIKKNGELNKFVWGDRDRIGQVLTNLLTNAIKYSPNANRIILTAVSEKDDAVITVEDFGIGIESEHLPKLFNRFYRASGDEENTFPGLGLGLYISNQIIKRHGGHMEVLSRKGKGSKFSFTLPYKK